MNNLIRKAREHDKAAFGQLMQEQGPGMYKVAKAILRNDEDAADAMQETVLTCWEKIETLKKEEHFKTWLTRILINHCNAIYRQQKITISEETAPETGDWDNSYANVEWEDFLNCLDAKYRTVVILYYVQGFKTREIAEILQINDSTIRGRLATAREKMEQQYRGTGKRGKVTGFYEMNPAKHW